MTAWAMSVVASLGVTGLAALIALENLFPPIPSEVVLPLAGFLVADGRLSFPAALGAATIGAVVGALVLYWLGARIGWDALSDFVSRHGRWLVLSRSDLDRAEAWFDRHGHTAVFLARLVPGARSVISIPAGASGMRFWRFVLYTGAGSALWNAVFISLGWAVGANWRTVSAYGQIFGYVATAALIGAAVWLLARHRRSRLSQR